MDDDLPDPPPVYHTGGQSPFDLVEPTGAAAGRVASTPGLWKVAYPLHMAHRPRPDGRCACGEAHPCEALWQAVAGLHAACAALRGAAAGCSRCATRTATSSRTG